MTHETLPTVTNDTEAAPEPVTVRDALSALFMPPSEHNRELAQPVARSQLLDNIRLNLSDSSSPDLLAIRDQSTTMYETEPLGVLAAPGSARKAIVGFGVVTAIGLSYLAQSSVAGTQDALSGWLLFALAGVIWIGLLAVEMAPPDGGLLRRGPSVLFGSSADRPQTRATQSSEVTRGLLVVMALALSGATYIFTAQNTFTLPGIVTWAVSIVGWLMVVAKRDPEILIEDFARQAKKIHLPYWRGPVRLRNAALLAALLMILAAAVFFRFYRIANIPGEMTSDHVEKLLDAYDVSRGQFHVFFPRNGGREAIQMYLVALASSLFGTGMSFLTLKLVTALEALALVPLIIWLGRELVGWECGLFAAALLAISWWDTSLARLGLRIVLTPLVFTCVLIVLIRGIRTRSRKSWVWAGIWMGVGVYSYQAMRMAPVVAVCAFLVAIIPPIIRALRADRSNPSELAMRRVIAAKIVGQQAANLAACAIVAFVFFVPMLRFWHDNPTALWNRVVNRTTSNEAPIQGSPLAVFVTNYENALGMFNVRGDQGWIDSVPGAPTLDMLTGGIFILGLIAWLMRLRVRRDPADAFFVIAGLIMLLPSALALAFPVENPSLTRASGTLPVAMVLAAWPLTLIRQRWRMVLGPRLGTALASGLIGLVLAGAAVLNYQTYFQDFDASYRLSALNPGEVAHAVRQVIGDQGSLKGVWLIGWPYWHDFRAIGIDAGDITFHNAILDAAELRNDVQGSLDQFDVRPLVFISAEQDAESRALLQAQFPQGHFQHYMGISEKHNFYLFIVPR